ncbi:MAG: site-2 protease family protein [Planctomycetota bacterium]
MNQWQPGGVRGFFARVFGDGDNPMRWAVPLYRLWGITVKLHLIFILFILIRLISSGSRDSLGLIFTAIMLAIVFGIVLLHEYGHCFACRWVGGEADEIMLWPLGGLAYCRAPHHWRAELITVLGGPGVNAVLLVPLGALSMMVNGGWEYAVFNPFQPNWPRGGVGETTVFLLHYINLVLLLFNMLVPMYPMDCGRVIQCLMWRKIGYEKSLWISCNIGVGAAIALAVVAFSANQMLLLGIALFGGFSCWQQKQSLKMMGFEPQYAAAYSSDDEGRKRKGPSRSQMAAIKKQQEDEARVEKLLAKIAQEGMGSLTPRERKFLDRVSQKKRQDRAG